MLLGNIAAWCWLLLCYFASVTPPDEVKYIALLSLTTPFAILANFIFVVIWLLSSRKLLSLISIAILAFCYQMIPAIFGLHYFSENDWEPGNNRFKLMTWNVHALGTFNHPHEKKHAEAIIDFIRHEDPDILCLPEFAMSANRKLRRYPEIIRKSGNYRSYYFKMDNNYGPHIQIGTALYSRYPVVHYQAHALSDLIFLLEVDILIGEQIVRVAAVHLKSFGLSDEDKAVIEQVKQQKTESLAKSRSFVWKFNQAYVERAREAEKVRQILGSSPYPVILCGDFNDLPYSYTYTTMKGSLNDAFSEKGRGFGRTYNQIIPTLRIDYILYNANALQVLALKTPYSGYSDHSPVIANFELTGNAKD